MSEKDSIQQLEEDLLLVHNDLTKSILRKEIEVRKAIRGHYSTNPIGNSKFGIRNVKITKNKGEI